jgi:hypothetical protein
MELTTEQLQVLQRKTNRRVKPLAKKLNVTARKLDYHLKTGNDVDLLRRVALLLVEEKNAVAEEAEKTLQRERLELEFILA